MRVLIWIVLAAGLLYGGYWFVGARAAERGAEAALAQMQARGWQVQQKGVSIAGFPSRFDLTVTEPDLFDPVRGIGWQAPFAQVYSLSYSPWKLIAALPEDQVLTLPGQKVTIGSTRMRASLFMKPSGDLPLDRLDAVTEGISLRSDAGWAMALGSANLSVIAGEGDQVQLALRGLEIVPDQAVTSALTGTDLPGQIARVDLLADVQLAAPILLRNPAPPVVRKVNLTEANLVWGPVSAKAAGELVADPQGQAEGLITVTVDNWQTGLAAAEAAGLVPERFRVALRSMLSSLADQGGDANRLSLPLAMQSGRMMLGPLPLGPAPMLGQGQPG
ncbi:MULTISPECIES: DUF2125 domain-containing protein [Gemmobacter]|jgi:hypothetical protein|uniref:DUF2125 domain-containing protein n=2 Tax=Gemmobacter TaxID=204456 RepID=A0A2T6B6P0_9RHOB|nr:MULTISPECIES: DUF2125 domain-containing protein [Gemmobacter]OJY33598.1 MAG: hypothetical protein BGP11_22250 [Rhodobacterales bacterium 65-51]PTX51727.1 hypothetical protein C8N34_103230 [Gemmobacter caeni]TWJ03855.1 hypothetical protein IQ03_00811 [Gemmobacter caeni]GHC11881.1 hypothetical protein GCM10007291_06020 [Gemmobacter nanjingensis]